MNLKRTAILLSTAFAALLLGGCMTKPLRPVEADGTYCYRTGRAPRHKLTCTTTPVPSAAVEAKAKQFEPTPNAVTVYIVRRRWADASNRVPVSVDGQPPVSTIPESFMRVRLSPGEHQLAFEWDGQRNSRTFAARANEIVFIDLAGAVWFWGTNYQWAATDSANARKKAVVSKLIADLDLRP